MFNWSKDYINLQIQLYRGFAMQKELPETILWNIFSFVLKDDSTIFIALLRKGPNNVVCSVRENNESSCFVIKVIPHNHFTHSYHVLSRASLGNALKMAFF